MPHECERRKERAGSEAARLGAVPGAARAKGVCAGDGPSLETLLPMPADPGQVKSEPRGTEEPPRKFSQKRAPGVSRGLRGQAACPAVGTSFLALADAPQMWRTGARAGGREVRGSGELEVAG